MSHQQVVACNLQNTIIGKGRKISFPDQMTRTDAWQISILKRFVFSGFNSPFVSFPSDIQHYQKAPILRQRGIERWLEASFRGLCSQIQGRVPIPNQSSFEIGSSRTLHCPTRATEVFLNIGPMVTDKYLCQNFHHTKFCTDPDHALKPRAGKYFQRSNQWTPS